MVKLADIHLNYSTDKGTTHSYIETYDTLFSKYQDESINVLETGVATGGSLKMYNEYFSKAEIYGIDLFTIKQSDVKDPNSDFIKNGASFDEDKVREDLAKFKRIHIIKDDAKTYNFGNDMKFSIIIDDYDHNPQSQIDTFQNLHKYLEKGGVYIIEDVVNEYVANKIVVALFNIHGDNFNIKKMCFDTEKRFDDILIVITRK
jgi:hypothetical protein